MLSYYPACENYMFLKCVQKPTSWLSCANFLNKYTKNRTRNLHPIKGIDDQSKTGHKWPLHNLFQLFDFDVGMYDLSIQPGYIKHQTNYSEFDSYYYYLKTVFENKTFNGSRLKQLFNMEKMMKHDINKVDINLYPQIINLTNAITEVQKGQILTDKPINDPNLYILNFPKQVCHPCHKAEQLDLLIIVKSCNYCAERRAEIRELFHNNKLWGTFKVKLVFVIGIALPYEQNIFDLGTVNITLYNDWWYRSTRYGSSRYFAMTSIAQEAEYYGDMLIGAFHDNYYNLTMKQMLTFRWLTTFCKNRIPIFLFHDDDYVVHPPNLVRLVRKYSLPQLQTFVGGINFRTSKVVRDSVYSPGNTWFVSEDEFPWYMYPTYFYGACYMLGVEIVNQVSIAMSFTRYFRIDDVYLGIILAKLNRRLTHLQEFRLDTNCQQLKHGVAIYPLYRRTELSKCLPLKS